MASRMAAYRRVATSDRSDGSAHGARGASPDDEAAGSTGPSATVRPRSERLSEKLHARDRLGRRRVRRGVIHADVPYDVHRRPDNPANLPCIPSAVLGQRRADAVPHGLPPVQISRNGQIQDARGVPGVLGGVLSSRRAYHDCDRSCRVLPAGEGVLSGVGIPHTARPRRGGTRGLLQPALRTVVLKDDRGGRYSADILVATLTAVECHVGDAYCNLVPIFRRVTTVFENHEFMSAVG
ncbi:hypothetical protein ACHAWF_017373 [Thalassiosira exigua]